MNPALDNKLYPLGCTYIIRTYDGDVYEGRMTFKSATVIELQIGSNFKSFNRRHSKITLINSY